MSEHWPVTLRSEDLVLRPLRMRDRKRWIRVRAENKDWLNSWEATLPQVPGEDSSQKLPSFYDMVRWHSREGRQGRSYSMAIWHKNGQGSNLIGQITMGGVIYGAMRAVPKAQLETGAAYGMSQRQVFWRILVPQMWVYALPGLGNIWILLIKATPLLFLLGIEDIVYWARELGGTKTAKFTDYPHGDYRMWYFFALLVFYLAFTKLSESVQTRLMRRLNKGQATLGGQAQARGSA